MVCFCLPTEDGEEVTGEEKSRRDRHVQPDRMSQIRREGVPLLGLLKIVVLELLEHLEKLLLA